MKIKKNLWLILGALIIIALLGTAYSLPIKEIYAKETDLIKLVPKSVDPDGDKVKYYFSSPFNESGEWQTDLNSSGNYDVDITASDGTSQTVEKTRIIVANKNQPPYLTAKKVFYKELETIDLKSIVKDPDNDPLSFVFNKPFDKNGLWKTGFGDAGNQVIYFKVDDGEFDLDFRVEIEIVNTNQPPIIENTFSDQEKVEIDENNTLEFWVKAIDSDENELKYSWNLDGKEIENFESGMIDFDYQSAGIYALNLSISDGTETTDKSWEIEVLNINRAPELELLPKTIDEDQLVDLKTDLLLPETDADGDKLTYLFDLPLNETGQWQTDFNTAGKQFLNFTVADGVNLVNFSWELTIIDVDQKPVFNLPIDLGVKEGEKLEWLLPISDPDNDPMEITFEELPDWITFDSENQTLSFSPSYDLITRRYGKISNLLNALRIEQKLMNKKDLPLKINACAQDLCTEGTLNLVLYNTNRAPVFENMMKKINVTETEEIKIVPTAVDLDGDLIKYSFSWPLDRKDGSWEPNFEDSGYYPIEIMASDGYLSNTWVANLTVINKDRQPEISVDRDEITINENQEFQIKVSAEDLDELDKLVLKVAEMPKGASFVNGTFTWKPDFDTVQNKTIGWRNHFISDSSNLNKRFSKDKEIVWLNFLVNDGTLEVGSPVKVTVKNWNQAPVFVNLTPINQTITALVNQPIIFQTKSNDPDHENLTYTWDFGWATNDVTGTDTIKRTFTSDGNKEVKLTVSDGFEEIEYQWNVKVVRPVKKVVKNETSIKPVSKPIVKPVETKPVTIEKPVIVPEEPKIEEPTYKVKVSVVE